jgi:translation initiation factor IF-2
VVAADDGVMPQTIEAIQHAKAPELSADYGGGAYGNVIEAELHEGRGPVARILVREGQLKIGDFIVAGRAFGRIRGMVDDRGRSLEEAGPATPLEISGLDEVPDAGDKFYVTDSLRKAEDIAEQRRDIERKRDLAARSKVSLDNVFEQMQAGEVKELRVVVKADVQGSVEVLRKTLEEVGADNEEVAVRVLHAAVGGITESDVLLAEASDAVIIGFQVIASAHARAEAERRNVDIRLYRVIYNVLDDVKNALEGMLNPQQREEVLGHAEVREVFRVSKVGMVAGCYVTDGVVRRNALIRVTRDDIVIEHDRVLSSLKRFKDDAREVRSGMECGMSISGYDDVRAGDVLECYVQTEVKQTL